MKLTFDCGARSIKGLAARYTAAWCSQDSASVAAFFERGGSLKLNNGDPAVGRAAIAAAAQGFMSAFPDLIVLMDGTSVLRSLRATSMKPSINGSRNWGLQGLDDAA